MISSVFGGGAGEVEVLTVCPVTALPKPVCGSSRREPASSQARSTAHAAVAPTGRVHSPGTTAGSPRRGEPGRTPRPGCQPEFPPPGASGGTSNHRQPRRLFVRTGCRTRSRPAGRRAPRSRRPGGVGRGRPRSPRRSGPRGPRTAPPSRSRLRRPHREPGSPHRGRPGRPSRRIVTSPMRSPSIRAGSSLKGSARPPTPARTRDEQGQPVLSRCVTHEARRGPPRRPR